MEPDPQANGGAATSANLDDASMHTITAASMNQSQAQQSLHQQQPSLSSNPSYDSRPVTSYSDTGFSRAYSQSADNTPDREIQQHQMLGNGLSRPPSASAGGSQYGDQRAAAQKNSSVVIKVGMVGDAQIGKTSLMVKYVEGSWDEDYIQTLGEC